MTEPSPFFDPDAPASDLEEFLREIEGKLDGCVPAEHEHLLLAPALEEGRLGAA